MINIQYEFYHYSILNIWSSELRALSMGFQVWTTNLEAIVDAFSCELQDPRRQAGKTISIAVTFLYCLLLHYPLGYLLFLQISVGFSSSRISAKLNDHRLAFEHIPINQILQWIVFNLAFSVCTKMKLIYASNQEGKKKPNYILLPQVDWTIINAALPKPWGRRKSTSKSNLFLFVL